MIFAFIVCKLSVLYFTNTAIFVVITSVFVTLTHKLVPTSTEMTNIDLKNHVMVKYNQISSEFLFFDILKKMQSNLFK